jgi:hypothetical protein
MAEKIVHAIPDIGILSGKKRLRAYEVINRELNEIVEKEIISQSDKGHVLLLLYYSCPDFKKAYDADFANMAVPFEIRNPLRDPGERVWFNKKYIYRFHIVVRIFFAAIFTVMILEENNLTDLMPSGHIFWPVFTIAFFIVIPLLVFSPYRNSYIELHEREFILPSLYIPPFRKHKIAYSDVLETKRISYRNSRKLKIKTRSGNYSVSQLHFTGYEFDDFALELEDRVRVVRNR